MHPTVSASLLKVLYKVLEIYHQDNKSLFNSVGLTNEMLSDEHKRLPYQTVYSLWLKATELIDDPCFGLKAADVFHPSDLNVLGYAWLSSTTLRTAFERFQRFQLMVSEFTAISLSESEDQFEITLNVKDDNMLTIAQMDAALSIFFRMSQINYGDSLKPSSVSIGHDEPTCSQKYTDYFACTVKFSQPNNSLSFPVEIIDKVLLNRAPNIALLADKTMIDYLESMQEENLEVKVKKAIMKQLPSEVSIDIVSSALHMTRRTLHRHLKEEGTSFKKILEKVRFDLSKQYILSQQYNLTEIAFQLGFSDSSAFSRAFKNWSGQPPTRYKKSP